MTIFKNIQDKVTSGREMESGIGYSIDLGSRRVGQSKARFDCTRMTVQPRFRSRDLPSQWSIMRLAETCDEAGDARVKLALCVGPWTLSGWD